MRTALILATALFAAPVAAQDACGKFDDPLAYNACLARQGPTARAAHVQDAPTGRARTHRMHGRIATTTHRGRAEMVFKVGR